MTYTGNLGQMLEKVQNEAQEAMMVFSDAIDLLDQTEDEISVMDMLSDVESLQELSGNLIAQWQRFMNAVQELEQTAH